ncbi:sigma-70 family RNA polymerase sigma factor [Pedobacter africanus]|uniref:RNA polymerase sigma-70 factor, ECF subfamily n=1 Tax=Pedobacter africanus TaxID=151894 RepID=A0A1W2DAJ7_9SPHI|nr:sigma-70 family RNA polymerase sigma factor [Pedobacter africanus]SMC94152.1 RNA polymerase sigma-70 factor, ECF subfamily [Pedobacter africanus]
MDYTHTTDHALLERCQHNDVKAYNEFFGRHSARLYKQALRYILNENIAEELMLDLLFDIWEKRHTRKIEGDIAAYLYRCMRNKIVDQRRKMVTSVTTIEQTTLTETLADRKLADHQLMTADADGLYQDVLQALSPQRRRVFQLSREERLTYPEIAREMNLSVNTVENYMSSALETFRNRTKKYLAV